MCYHTEFGLFTPSDVGISRGEPLNMGVLGPRPLECEVGRWVDILEISSPICVTLLNLVMLYVKGCRHNNWRTVKFGRAGVPPLKMGEGWPLKRPLTHMLPCQIWLL